MYKNSLYLALVGIFFLVAIWFSILSAVKVYDYQQMTEKMVPTTLNWSYEALSSDKFVVKGVYNFKSFSGKTVFNTPTYKSLSAVQKVIEDNQSQDWKVWYNPKYPEKSTLQKVFPYKSIGYSLVLWGIFLYFVCLGFYASKIKKGLHS